MRVILVDRNSLAVSVAEVGGSDIVVIPAAFGIQGMSRASLERLVYEPLAARASEEHYRRLAARNRRLRRKGLTERHSFELPALPAWAAAMASIMWAGIVGNVAWEVIKVALRRAVRLLREAGMVPSAKAGGRETAFTWALMLTSAKTQRDVYRILLRCYNERGLLAPRAVEQIFADIGELSSLPQDDGFRGSIVFALPARRSAQPTRSKRGRSAERLGGTATKTSSRNSQRARARAKK